ncbi:MULTISPECIES: inorganic phosphate transporter [unclassified Rhizobium]|uniref:inorganic phosphate transporter n=1 Tax=unclassified Rhizobium TaxID=2613769 RepID=UPI001612008A|nr:MULTISPECIES: inorganic phosphate transporter [unclassified Rhizobium]MBB3540166.1 PiT family inorganic phosphate transporter [Rhizobium sp. BK399]MCS3738823.1 PiT family inorganic phosphate transporter [Rhizobium sp. BK661]
MTIVQGEEHRHDRASHPLEGRSAARWFLPVFLILLLAGLGYVAYALGPELTSAAAVPWILLGIALLIALGFEFVNGFHDTANSVATVIYTRSMPAELGGLGTMVGWKRIVVTVGEKIGKTHLTYGQGAAAEVVAMATIGAADHLGLPVSTTHVLSSGVAGTMAANGSGLQWSTVRNMLMAWILTLPASIMIAFLLFVVLRQLF